MHTRNASKKWTREGTFGRAHYENSQHMDRAKTNRWWTAGKSNPKRIKEWHKEQQFTAFVFRAERPDDATWLTHRSFRRIRYTDMFNTTGEK